MAEYRLTNQAVKDLSEIWNYTVEKWSEKQADKYYDVLLENCQNVADKPEFGKSYDQVTSNLLGVKVNKHIIFYRKLDSQTVEITRILHGRMDLKRRLNE